MPPRERARRFPEEVRLPAGGPLQPQGEPEERRLAASVGAGDGDELAGLDAEIDVAKHGPVPVVGERDTVEPKRGYVHPSPRRSAERLSRITLK